MPSDEEQPMPPMPRPAMRFLRNPWTDGIPVPGEHEPPKEDEAWLTWLTGRRQADD